MKAMLVPEGGMPRLIEVEGLKGLQAVVGGCIEPCSWVFEDQPAVYVNEEGKFTCSPNRAVYATASEAGAVAADGHVLEEGDVIDVLFGDFVCIGFDPETGEDRDITDAEAAKVHEKFGTIRSIDSGVIESLRIMLEASAARL